MRSVHFPVSILSIVPVIALGGACNRAADASQPESASTPKATAANPSSAAKSGSSANSSSHSSPSPTTSSHANSGTAAGSGSAQTANEVEQTKRILAHLDAATRAIQQGDTKQAGDLLDQTATTLRSLYENVPGRSVLNSMNTQQKASSHTADAGTGGKASATGNSTTGGKTNEIYAPIAATVAEQSVYLDPQVVANVKKAESQAHAGNEQAAQSSLKLAREGLVADIALLPVEDAYSRVLAARSELEAGRRENALQLLQNVPIVLSEVQMSAPLVPAQFDLRAAAAAAEKQDWQRAQQLVGEAQKRLDEVTSTGGKAGSAIQPLAQRADKLETRLRSSSQKPKAAEIRALADDLRKVRSRM